MLQDLCPRCGADLLSAGDRCAACGFDGDAGHALAGRASSGRLELGPAAIGVLLTTVSGMVFGAFLLGTQLPAENAAAENPSATDAPRTEPSTAAPRGRVLFAERLGEALELHDYQTAFTRDDTIAWRLELPEPPPTAELEMLLEWYTIRERMTISEVTVTLNDPRLTVIASEEVALRELVPTAGLYAVSYYAADAKLAEGIFEVLPPDR